MNKPAKTKENLKKCICMKCPSYTFACKIKNMPKNIMGMMGDIREKDHFEGLYCAFEKSDCIKDRKGCICGSCAVSKESDLSRGYFCIKTDGE